MEHSGDIIKQIQAITADLQAVRKKVGLLGDMQALTLPQKEAVRSLARGLDSVRGFELGAARQSLGLDQDLAGFSKGLLK